MLTLTLLALVAIPVAIDLALRVTDTPPPGLAGRPLPFIHVENPDASLPDVIIERNDDGQLEARLTGEHLPHLRINDFYKDMIGKNGVDAKARQFLRDQIRDGRSLIRSISLRQETIVAIAGSRHQWTAGAGLALSF